MISTVLVTIVGIILIFVYAGHWVRIIILNLMILEIFPLLWKRAKLKNAETVTQESLHLFVQSGVDAQRVRLSGYL